MRLCGLLLIFGACAGAVPEPESRSPRVRRPKPPREVVMSYAGIDANEQSGVLTNATFAIPILMVETPGAVPDYSSLRAAKRFTTEVRGYARRDAGLGTNHELVDLMLLAGCTRHTPKCMKQVGRDLGVDFLIWGRASATKDALRVTLSMFDVHGGRIVREWAEAVPLDASGDLPGRAWHHLISGYTGTIVIDAPRHDGVAYMDGDQRGTFHRGSVQISNVPMGLHTVVVSVPPAFEKAITIEVVPNRTTRLRVYDRPGRQRSVREP